jgi:hypothetical protein
MKRIILFLTLLLAPALYAQTVKPALPTTATDNAAIKPALPTITVPPASLLHSDNLVDFSTIASFVVPLCGWQGRERDDGQCEITITAPPDYENFKCTVHQHKQGELYVITCTWKPKEQK